MKIEVTITPESAGILAAAIVSAMSGAPAVPAGTPPAKPATKAKEKAAPPAVTLDDLRASATKVVDAGKKDLLAPALAKFGAKKITELKPEQYTDALAAFEAAAVATAEEDPMA